MNKAQRTVLLIVGLMLAFIVVLPPVTTSHITQLGFLPLELEHNFVRFRFDMFIVALTAIAAFGIIGYAIASRMGKGYCLS